MSSARMLLLICSAIFSAAAAVEDQRVAIALLHRRGSKCDGDETSLAALQRETAAQWACQVINNQTNPHLFSIDVLSIDSCGDSDVAVQRALRIVKQSALIPILGVIALEDADVLTEAAKVLRRHQIPLVVATPKSSETLLFTDPTAFLEPNNVFSAVPNTAAVARATLAVAKGIQGGSIRILGTCPLTIRAAAKAANQLRIKVELEEQWLANYSSVAAFIDSLPVQSEEETESNPHMVALLMEPSELQAFMSQALKMAVGHRITWLLGCVGSIDPHTAAQWALSLGTSAFLIEPHLLELAGLADYFQSQAVEHHPLDNEIPHIVQAVSALGAAFHLQELSNCQSKAGVEGSITCHPERLSNPAVLPSQMLSALRQLSLPQTPSDSNNAMASPRQLEGTSNHFTPSGRLVANRYLIQKLMAGTGETSPVAWYSDDDGLVLAAVMTSQSNGRFYFFNHGSSGPLLSSVSAFTNLDETLFLVDTAPAISPQHHQQEPELKQEPTQSVTRAPEMPLAPASVDQEDQEDQEEDEERVITSTPHWSHPIVVQGRTWSAAIVALAATEMLGAFYMLIVMIIRLCDGSLRGAHQVLGLLLLTAVLLQLSSVVLFVLPAAQQLVCHMKLYLPPMLLVTCYSILLAKLLHLRHYASAGLGGQVPQFPLYLSVLLSMAVQAAVSAHYDALQQQHHHFDCHLARDELPLLYLFPIILVGMTAGYSLCLRSIRRQQAEAQWILVSSSASAAVLLAWLIACASEMPLEYRDAATASLLVVLAAIVLLCIFVPVMTKLHPLRTTKPTAFRPNPCDISSKLSTYTCNISVASTIPNPWLNNLEASLGKPSCIDTATSQLSGSQLLRHPTYTGRL